MVRRVLNYFGRTLRNTAMTLLTIIGLIWAADALLGIGPGHRLGALAGDRLWALGERAGAMLEEVAGAYWDEQTLLGWRAQRTINLLEDEIERLQWVEAESLSQARAVDAQLANLAANLETTRAGLLDLAALMRLDPGALTVDGVRYEGAQIEAFATQQMVEFAALQAQVELYRQAQSAHRSAALDARALWMEATQNIQTLEAHNALLKATMALTSAQAPDSETSRNVHQLGEQLRVQLDRNQRIVEKRRLLEDDAVVEKGDLIDLGTLLARSEDMAGALEQLAADAGQP